MKKGFTLVEMLIVLFTLPVILLLSIGILQVIGGFDHQVDDQFEVFKLQLRYLRQTVGQWRSIGDEIHYSFDGKEYQIKFDKDRLIKTPGYEILLFDVDEVGINQGCLSVRHTQGWYCLEE